MIRIYIAEDQAIVREGLKTMLSIPKDMQVVGEASNGQEAFSMLSQSQPDLLLLDQRMPILDGIHLIEKLRSNHALPATILLTTFDDYELLSISIQAGVKGFLLKDAGLETLLRAIRIVANNGTWFQIEALNIDKNPNQPYVEINIAELTPKEQEVLRLMASGMSNKRIARIMNTSDGTIKNYVSNILSKLEVRDRTQAVVKAIRLGILN